MKASAFYRSELWRVGLAAGRTLSPRTSAKAARALSQLYGKLNGKRKEIVVQNLLPAFAGDRATAVRASERLFRNFGQKLADLWQYESGRSIESLLPNGSGWADFERLRAMGRGILLVTPHIGNWEFGGPLLKRHQINLKVITLVEPDRKLTKIRQVSRERWGMETYVIGEDPFAFIDVVKGLEAGAVVALLIDRPPESSAVTVQLFDRPFLASIAPAELARATGCIIAPVYLPRLEEGYGAFMLPEIEYDRRALGKRAARIALTQTIVSTFEPVIRNYPDQWYHFVPVWEPKI